MTFHKLFKFLLIASMLLLGFNLVLLAIPGQLTLNPVAASGNVVTIGACVFGLSLPDGKVFE